VGKVNGAPIAGVPEFQAQLFMLYWRLLHVGETFNRFADFGLRIAQKMLLAAGGAIALPRPLAVIMGRGGREGEGKG